MSMIFIVITIFCLFLSYKIEKNIYNPVFLLSAFWLIIGFGASLCLYGMDKASDKTYVISLLGILFFSLGGMFAKNCLKDKRIVSRKSKKTVNYKYVFKIKYFRILILIMIIYSAHRMLMVVQMLKSGYTLDITRMVYFGTNVGGYQISNLDSIIEIFIHLPSLYATISLISLNIVLPKEKKIIDGFTTIIAVVWIIMAQFITGGRMTIYIFAMEIVIAYLVLNRTTITKGICFNSKRIKIVGLVIAAILLLYILSLGRKNSVTYDVFKALYIDFCGCFPHMSLRLDEIDFNKYTWGVSLLSGVLRPIMLFVKWIVGSYPEIYQRTIDIGSQLQGAVMVGRNMEYNAYVLPVFYFYYDCAYLGVIIDSYICGIACHRVYTKMKSSNMEILQTAFYLMIVYAIFTSMVRYAGNLVYYVFAFVVIRLLFKKVVVYDNII